MYEKNFVSTVWKKNSKCMRKIFLSVKVYEKKFASVKLVFEKKLTRPKVNSDSTHTTRKDKLLQVNSVQHNVSKTKSMYKTII